MIQRLLPVAALAILALLVGCSCNERVYVRNDTNEMLHVQIQLPKPKVPWHCGCKCVYEALINPGGVWTTARPGSPDQMDHPIEPYSECAVVRARIGVQGQWARFTLCGPLVESSPGDPIMLAIGQGNFVGLNATARTQGGSDLAVEAIVIEE
ncbi:MAG: hypothetical protein KF724_11240 [Phycisphaeraceae bacterium]|nr:hypothetical protein [Phycisphaeraceae bacterium]